MSLRRLAIKTLDENLKLESKKPINNLCSVSKDCRDCSLGCGKAVSPTGPENISEALLIVIGERPGNTEVRSGNHFVGELSRIARVLTKKIVELDTRLPDRDGKLDLTKPEQVIYTNAVLCKPQKDGAVTKTQYATCSKYNLEILSKTDCPVLLCGGAAISNYLPIDSKLTVREARGKVYRLEGRSWVCTFNPAVIQRGIFYKEDKENNTTKADIKPDICFDSMPWHFIRDLILVKSEVLKYLEYKNKTRVSQEN